MTFKKLLLAGLICVLWAPVSRLPAAEVNWNFNKPGAAAGWIPVNIAANSVAEGIWTIQSAAGRPMLISPEVKIDAANQPVVNVRMKLAKGLASSACFLFRSDAAPNWDDKTVVVFYPFSDGEWHDYEIDMSKNPYWKGTVKQLRFQPMYIADSALTKENALIRLQYFRVPDFQWPSAAGNSSGASLSDSKNAIENKRVAIFFEPGFPGGTGSKDLFWYQGCLKEFGLNPTVAGAEQISNTAFLTKKKFDTLILPSGAYLPFEAGYSVCNFLAEGGNVITGALPRCVKYNAEKKQWDTEKKRLFKSEAYEKDGVPMELQIRTLGQKQTLDSSLKLNPYLLSLLSTDMALRVGPFQRDFSPLTKTFSEFEGAFKENAATAANTILPVYLLPGGEGTDFVGYRYHNLYFNDSTLVHLGVLGSALLDTPYGKNVLRACLKLCETEFPQEQEPAYYQRLIDLQKETSALGKDFVETSSRLRDVAFCRFYRNKQNGFAEAQKKLLLCEDALSYVMREKQDIDKLLVAGSDYQGQDEKRKKLLAGIKAEKQRLKNIRNEAEREVLRIGYPGDVKIQSPFGRIQIEAGMTALPTLYSMRKDFFQTMKELGANVHYSQCAWAYLAPYLDDPEVKETSRGITFCVVCNPVYCQDTIMTGPWEEELNPATGEVKQTARRARPRLANEEGTEKEVQEFTADWKGRPIARAITCCFEEGLKCGFWGEQAREEYLEHLKKKYDTIAALNQSWTTDYKDFNDIQLLTSPPNTLAQHGNFEDWIDYREEVLESYMTFSGAAVKKYNPGMPISAYSGSAFSINSAIYGFNFYRFSKTGDINGIDCTYGVPPDREWIWFDLNCGKPVLSAEWSAFYWPPESILLGRTKLCEEAWTIVSGGSVGLNLWIWRWDGFRGDYVDKTGLPTLYGWELKSLVSDFLRFDHIILDGKRKDPEVRILFSNASRVHNQTWNNEWTEFDANSSPHLTATMNLYSLFLSLQEPARVIAEEAILEGADLSSCKLLIVPQAEYLSDEVQRKLLAYAREGGNLMLEGRAGTFDHYGRPLNLLFRQAGIIPSAAEKKEVILPDGTTFPVSKPENSFAVSLLSPEKGKTLLSYSNGEPAIVSVPLGKGKVLVSGAPFSLERTKETVPLIMEQIYREIALPPKYVCSDKNLILREWEYQGDDYLICAYPKTGEEKAIKKFQLKIRGNWQVSDYLLGTAIPSSFDGDYTRLSCLIMSPGGCVYKMSGGTAPVTRISGDAPKKKQIPADPALDGKVKKTEKRVFSSACSLEQKDGALILTNGLVRVKIVPERGKIVEYTTLSDEVNQVAPAAGYFVGGIKENNGGYPGVFHNQKYSYKILEDTPEQIKILLEIDRPSDGLRLEKTIGLKKNESKISLDIEEYNLKDVSAPLALVLHPELSFGETAYGKNFFIPTSKGLESFVYSTRDNGASRVSAPNAGWAACCNTRGDKNEQTAYIYSFPPDEVKSILVWIGPDRYTFELFTPQKQIEAGKALALHADIFLVKGLSEIDIFDQGIAANIILSKPTYSQDKDINFTVEASNALLNKQNLKGEISVLKDGRKIETASEFSSAVAYDEPLERKLSFSAKELADGEYEVALSLFDDGGKQVLSAAKPFVLIGEKLKTYAKLKERLAQLKNAKGSEAADALFDVSVAIEEFRMSLEHNNYTNTEESLRKAEALMKKIEGGNRD